MIGDMAHMVENLSSKYKALSSNSNTIYHKKTQKTKKYQHNPEETSL
jgi:hypothetical protein